MRERRMRPCQSFKNLLGPPPSCLFAVARTVMATGSSDVRAQTDFHLLTRSSPKRRLTMPSTAPTCSSGSINSFALLQVLIRMTRRKGRTTWESEETIEQSHCLNTNFSDSIELVPLTVCSHSVAPDAQECEDHSMKNVGDVT
mmetsp:Transcript_3721/g.13352  ORF Transcript_3721/g.13352 Transcript_3721/m.13352 type:complete len:143 (+) Transcript_3721:2207-2635(+)